METQQGNFTKADVEALFSRLKQFVDDLPAGEREALKYGILAPAKRSAESVLEMWHGPVMEPPGWGWGDWFRFMVMHLDQYF